MCVVEDFLLMSVSVWGIFGAHDLGLLLSFWGRGGKLAVDEIPVWWAPFVDLLMVLSSKIVVMSIIVINVVGGSVESYKP